MKGWNCWWYPCPTPDFLLIGSSPLNATLDRNDPPPPKYIDSTSVPSTEVEVAAEFDATSVANELAKQLVEHSALGEALKPYAQQLADAGPTVNDLRNLKVELVKLRAAIETVINLSKAEPPPKDGEPQPSAPPFESPKAAESKAPTAEPQPSAPPLENPEAAESKLPTVFEIVERSEFYNRLQPALRHEMARALLSHKGVLSVLIFPDSAGQKIRSQPVETTVFKGVLSKRASGPLVTVGGYVYAMHGGRIGNHKIASVEKASDGAVYYLKKIKLFKSFTDV